MNPFIIIIDKINNNPFSLSIPFLSSVKLDIQTDITDSLKHKLGLQRTVTIDLALRIFEQIQLNSNILSFLIKPIVAIPVCFAISLSSAFFIPTTGMMLIAIKVTLCFSTSCLGGAMISFSIKNPLFLSHLSKAYEERSKAAAGYITELRNAEATGKTSVQFESYELD